MGFMARRGFPQASYDTHDPETIEERRAVAGQCEEALRYGVITYVDEMDDAVMVAYAGWPTRLYLIDVHGVVVYAGGPGPYGFHPAKFDEAIAKHLSR